MRNGTDSFARTIRWIFSLIASVASVLPAFAQDAFDQSGSSNQPRSPNSHSRHSQLRNNQLRNHAGNDAAGNNNPRNNHSNHSQESQSPNISNTPNLNKAPTPLPANTQHASGGEVVGYPGKNGVMSMSGTWTTAYRNPDGKQVDGVLSLLQRGDFLEGEGSDPKGTFNLAGQLSKGEQGKVQVRLEKQYVNESNAPLGIPIIYNANLDGVNPRGPFFLHVSGTWKFQKKTTGDHPKTIEMQGEWEGALIKPSQEKSSLPANQQRHINQSHVNDAIQRPSTDNWTGTYEATGDLRTATISRMTVDKVDGQPRLHVWFYGKPDDIDWGEFTAKEYESVLPSSGGHRARTSSNFRWTAILHHANQDSILIITPAGGSINNATLKVQSFTSFAKTDPRHQDTAAEDHLRKSGSAH